jgi:UDP-2,3-diacylglucosamine hydrolase
MLQLDSNTGFVSDIHLSPDEPVTRDYFFESIDALSPFATRAGSSAGFDKTRRGLSALFILGDLFDSWIGDDILQTEAGSFGKLVAAKLASLGCPIFLCHGNRDFLLSNGFCETLESFGVKTELITKDHFSCSLPARSFGGNGEPEYAMLSHGDQWCTEDTDYQSFRTKVRSASWQSEFLAKPIDERLKIAQQLRGQSTEAKAQKPNDIMDVNPRAIREAFERSNASVVIHGHTHRPAKHRLVIEGSPRQRIVLPDWDGVSRRGKISTLAELLPEFAGR